MTTQVTTAQRRARPTVVPFRRLLVLVTVGALVVLLVRATLVNAQVSGVSMSPTLGSGQLVLVDRAVHSPKRGDVIVFRSVEEEGQDLIKRVIGVPGDTVEMRDGVVYLNGEPLDERGYIPAPGSTTMDPVTIPEGRYWVMGDNRTESYDSRDFGTIPGDHIIGRAWFSYWPWRALGLVHAPHARSPRLTPRAAKSRTLTS